MNKKGFTLVELIATIIILGVILTIAVPSYNIYIEKTKESKCNADKRAILDAAQTYVTQAIYKNTTILNEVKVSVLRDGYGLNDEYSKYDELKVTIDLKYYKSDGNETTDSTEDADGITDYVYEISDMSAFESLCK